MASLTAISTKPGLAPQTAYHKGQSQTRAFTTSRPRRVLARAEKKEVSDDEAKDIGKQAVNKGGNAYIDELPVSLSRFVTSLCISSGCDMSDHCIRFAAAHP